jgi:ribonuclease G
MSITTAEKCPTCLGTGTVTSSVLISDDIENNLEYLITTAKHNALTVLTNPYLAAYIKQGVPSKRMQWFYKYKIWVKVKVDIKQGMLDYSFLDGQGESIDLDKH